MLQRLVDIKTDATAAFEKESKLLLVRLDDDLISLALADKETGNWEAAEILKADTTDRSGEDFIGKLKHNSSLINYKGLGTRVLVSTTQAMAVPVALSGSVPLFFEMQFGRQSSPVLTDMISDEILMAFSPPAWQQQLANTLFPEAEMVSTLALQTRQSLLHARDEGTCLYVQVGKTYAEIVLIQQGQLAIARCLPYSTNTDLLYHLLNTARQFDVKPASLSLQVQGIIMDEDELYQTLQSYFAPVSLASNITPIRHKSFWTIPPHFFTGLMYRS